MLLYDELFMQYIYLIIVGSQVAYSRVLPPKPGALLSLLEGIMNLQSSDGVSDLIKLSLPLG